MTLKNSFSLLAQSSNYRDVLDPLKKSTQSIGRAVLLDSALPYCVGGLRNDLNIPILVLVTRPERSRQLYEDISFWCRGEGEVYHLPELDIVPFEQLVANGAATHERITALTSLLNSSMRDYKCPPIVVASIAAMSQKTFSKEILEDTCHYITVGQRITLSNLLLTWHNMGYRMEKAVEVEGTISRRGGILDIYSPGSQLPARVELLEDVVESIRLFNPESQRSVRSVDKVFILPAQETLPYFVPEDYVKNLYLQMDTSNCTSSSISRIKEDLSMISAGSMPEEPGFYNGFFCPGTPMDFFPENGLLVVERPSEIEEEGSDTDERTIDLRLNKENRDCMPRNFPSTQISRSQLVEQLSSVLKKLNISPWAPSHDSGSRYTDMGFIPSRSYSGRLLDLANDVKNWQENGDRTLIISNHVDRLADVFQGQGISVKLDTEFVTKLARSSVVLIHSSTGEGWRFQMPDSAFHLLTDVEIMGKSKERSPRRRNHIQRTPFLSDLEPGNYLVHTEHGIARFAGTSRVSTSDGNEREYLLLEYAEGDKLYVPTDQMDRVSLYIAPGDRIPSLTRLSTQEWNRSKARAKASTKELAQHLLEIYASREITEGISFSADTPWQQEMEDSFPYDETPDQLDSIKEVKTDMESTKPMDRLVCGDVGYGKTEVALRAAFKAVMDGHQVAMLVPTTVLAEQHYKTFTHRLSNFPMQIEVLSRFRTAAEQQRIKEKLNLGQVDICIGTHRILQKDVIFKNLGLVIVDEEQRFGVAHKEQLKSLRKDADILTLSATPIPRTLHMTLSGIRDMSTINTPPDERLAIKTYVSEYSEDVIRAAIIREIDRGGQVFFLHNRVRTIEETAEKVRRIVPGVTVVVGHGQMPENVLASVMSDFAQNKYDVLVCTTIIEAGLDIPNVNTLVIDRADMLGLAQLYQLRGRIGRSTHKAYAYLMIPPRRRITESAEKRLKTILAATELGSGFQIAMRDLEIRGAGNILGSEQSGHIQAIGYELYSQLLSQAVEEIKTQKSGIEMDDKPQLSDPKLDLSVAAYIPTDYIQDLSTRLGMYQRLARLSHRNDIAVIGNEIKDRFGPLPKMFDNLLSMIEIKILARSADTEAISQNKNVAVIHLNKPIEGARLALQKSLGSTVQVGNKQIKVQLTGNWSDEIAQILEGLTKFKDSLPSISATRI